MTALDPRKMGENTRHRLEMSLRLCRTIRERPPVFGCFGMHEWAMVYRGDAEGEVRHGERLPLRLGQDATDAFVRSRPLGFEPVKVETPAGKLEYERRQRALSEAARPLRDALIERLEAVLES